MLLPVCLTVVPEAAHVALGGQLAVSLTLQNISDREACYHLDISGIPVDWYDLDQPRIALLPAASAQVLLTIHPPADAVAGVGHYILTVQVRAEEDPAIQAATAVALTVRTGGGLDMDVQPVEAVGQQGLFSVTFLNQLAWPVYVALTARDHENGLHVRIEPAALVVVPATGVAGPIMVRVVPKVRALLGAPHPYEIQVQAVELGGEDQSPASLERRARFVYVPRYPARRLPVWLRTVAAGRYALTAQVTAEDDPALPAAAAVALTIRTGSGVDMDVQPTDVAGHEATFRLTYHNHSPAPVALALLAHASEEGLRFCPEPAEPVVVPVDRAGSVVVHVVPKMRPLVGVPHAYALVFRALQLWTVPQSTAELVREARFTYVPYVRPPALARVPVWVRRLPVWTGALALVLLVLLLVLARDRTLATTTRTAVMRTPAPPGGVQAVPPGRPLVAQGRTRELSRPSIRRFTLVHRRQGQPYELVWQTSDATYVTLDGRPVAERGDMELPAPLHSATYRLVATNDARRTTAHLHVVVDALTTDTHAVVLALPDIATFAVRRRHGQRYAIWLVRHAVYVQLQGRPVASVGERLILPGASTQRLVASNDVGIRQSLLPLAPPVPTATAARPTRTPTTVPLTVGTIASGLATLPLGAVTALPTPLPTVTPMSVTVGSTPPGSVTTPPPATTVTTTSTASPVSPAVLLNPGAVDFGQQRVSTTSAVHVVYVVNVGEAPLTVTTVAITGPDPGDFAERDSCTYANVGVTGGCTISVRFTPLTTGTRSATLVIADNAPGSPRNVPLKGQG